MSRLPEFQMEHALKAQQWERAKGELRALVALQGSYSNPLPPGQSSDRETRWHTLSQAVKDFIEEVEDNALQE